MEIILPLDSWRAGGCVPFAASFVFLVSPIHDPLSALNVSHSWLFRSALPRSHSGCLSISASVFLFFVYRHLLARLFSPIFPHPFSLYALSIVFSFQLLFSLGDFSSQLLSQFSPPSIVSLHLHFLLTHVLYTACSFSSCHLFMLQQDVKIESCVKLLRQLHDHSCKKILRLFSQIPLSPSQRMNIYDVYISKLVGNYFSGDR